jgi:hypothetical protein
MGIYILLQNADNDGPVNTISIQRKPEQSLPSYLVGQLVDGCIKEMAPTGNNRQEITIYTVAVFLLT